MTEIITKPFRKAHLDIFDVAPDHKEECWSHANDWHQLGTILQAGSHILNGKIMYISAYIYRAPGVVEVFMHPSIHLPKYKLVTIKHIKYWILFVKEQTQAHRLQTWGDNGELSDRWLKWLGFTKEGVLSSYRPDGGSVSIWGMTWAHY